MWPWLCYVSCLCLTILFCKWGYRQHYRVIVVVEEDNALKCYLSWPTTSLQGFPGGAVGIQVALKLDLFGSAKNLSANAGDTEDTGLIPWRKAWQPTSVFLPGKFHGQRGLNAYGTWGHKEWDTIEPWARVHTHRISTATCHLPSCPAWCPNDHCASCSRAAGFFLSHKQDWIIWDICLEMF